MLEIDDSWGTVDYIICHGVYSWVPPNVREHILKEQNGVFPATLTVLDTAGWEQVATVRGHAGSALDPPHGDHSHPRDHHHGLGA